MSSGLAATARAFRRAAAAFDPALLSGDDCAALAAELAATEKACAAARARAAARATACGAHRTQGFADPADWLARVSGSSRGEAQATIDTVATAAEACPRTNEALVSGALSLAQAREIVTTEAARPGSEAELLGIARREGLAVLKDEARKRRLAAVDPEQLHRRQQAARSFRHWRDGLGMVAGCFALPPEVGVAFVNRLDAETDRLRRRARREGRVEPRAAHAADALVALASGEGRGRARGADMVVVCDLGAYRRGHAHAAEPSHIVGGGPVPVSVARELAEDAFIKAVTHDGVAIDTVAHLGRHIPAELRTALELGPVPDFEGTSCTEAGCGRRYGLEWDHVDPRANGGPTSFVNLVPRCWPHHREKTERDRRAGLLQGARDGRAPP